MSNIKSGSTLTGKELEHDRAYAKLYNAWQEYGEMNNYKTAAMAYSFSQDELKAIRECLETVVPMAETGSIGLNTETATIKAVLAKVAALLK